MKTPTVMEQPDCAKGPFETDLVVIEASHPLDTPPVQSQRDANFPIPIEISRISDGAVSFFRGGLMNEGSTTWYAFDLQRRLFIAVLGMSGQRLRLAPDPDRLVECQLLRHTDACGYRRAEFVTVLVATAAQTREFSCLANKILAAVPDAFFAHPAPADSLQKCFTLLRGGMPISLETGRKAWEAGGELEKFIKAPLQMPILQAFGENT